MRVPALLLVLLAQVATGVWAAELPVTMVLSGRIEAGSGPAPQAGDRVLVFAASDGAWIGDGTVATGGLYTAIASRFASFNGTTLVLELQRGNRRHAILKPDGRPASMAFAGRLLPEITRLDVSVGPQTAELPLAQAGHPQAQRLTQRVDIPCDRLGDANGDGVCDEADWTILRRYAGGVSRSVALP